MVRGWCAVLGLVVLLSAACGGGDEDPSGSRSTSTGAPAATGASTAAPLTPEKTGDDTVVPDVVLRDVATGTDVKLRALGLPDRPTLYWFWAPH